MRGTDGRRIVPSVPNRPTRNELRIAAARGRALHEWRRVDWVGIETAWADKSLPAAQLVPGVLSGLKLEQRVAESQILQVWNRVIDPTTAAHATPVQLNKGTLFVNVDSSAWLSEIVRYRRREILERIQLVVGSEMVQRISFRAAG